MIAVSDGAAGNGAVSESGPIASTRCKNSALHKMIPAIDDASPGVIVGAAPKPNFDSEPTGSLSDVRLSRVCLSGSTGKHRLSAV